MRKRPARLNSSAGFSLAEILITVAIMGFVSALMVSLVSMGLKTQRQTNLDTQAHMLYRNFVALLNADKSWNQTIAKNGSLGCLAAGNCGSGADKKIRITTIADQDGNAYYTYSPTSGYTNQGVACPAGTSFNGTTGSGNDQCPLHYDIFWWPICAGGAASCSDPTVHFSIIPIYNPNTKSAIPFNALNYGTADYVRGSEAYACNFVFDVGLNQLTETCASGVGIGTANSDRAELTVTQPTTLGIYAQEWQRGGNYLDLDVQPYSKAGTAVTFQSPNSIMLTAQNDPAKPQLFLLNTNGYVGIGTTNPQWPFSTVGAGPAIYGGSPEIMVNQDDHLGGGILVSNDGGFFDYNDGYVTFNGLYGLRVDGNNGVGSNGTLLVTGQEGIGTTKPVSQLHTYTAAASNIVTFQSTSGNNTWLSVQNTAVDAHFGAGVLNVGAYVWSNNGKTYLGAEAAPTLLADDTTGRVGINTVSPKAALEVVPLAKGSVANIPGSFSGGIHTRDIALDNAIILGLNGTQTMRIANNAATSQADGRFSGSLYARAFFYNSDERLKTNIEDLQDPLERVCHLRGVSFNWKSTGEKEMGFIAQEVNKVEPSLVSVPDDATSMLAVKYGNIVALVVEAIKKLRDMLFAHDLRIQKLESENQELRLRLDRLERVLSGGAKMAPNVQNAPNENSSNAGAMNEK